MGLLPRSSCPPMKKNGFNSSKLKGLLMKKWFIVSILACGVGACISGCSSRQQPVPQKPANVIIEEKTSTRTLEQTPVAIPQEQTR